MLIIRIVSCNIPESYIHAIEKLVGRGGLYPSRSELVRCAVREFLQKELAMIKNMSKFKEEPKVKDDDDKFVRIPIEKINKNGDIIRKFQTYKIIERLE